MAAAFWHDLLNVEKHEYKQSKKAQKEYNNKQQGSWNGLCPVTRTVPNRKAYDRNRIKHEDRRIGGGAD